MKNSVEVKGFQPWSMRWEFSVLTTRLWTVLFSDVLNSEIWLKMQDCFSKKDKKHLSPPKRPKNKHCDGLTLSILTLVLTKIVISFSFQKVIFKWVESRDSGHNSRIQSTWWQPKRVMTSFMVSFMLRLTVVKDKSGFSGAS